MRIEISNAKGFEEIATTKLNALIAHSWQDWLGADSKFFVYMTIFLVFYFSVILFMSTGRRSYLILNQHTKLAQERDVLKSERLWYGVVSALILGAFSGVAANKITSFVDWLFS